MRSTQVYLLIALAVALYIATRTKESFLGDAIEGGKVSDEWRYAQPASSLVRKPRVWVYEHDNYGGSIDTYPPGKYPRIDSDRITSIKVPAGYELLFYTDEDFQGEVGKLTAGNYPNIGEYWNDRISSLKVAKLIRGSRGQIFKRYK